MNFFGVLNILWLTSCSYLLIQFLTAFPSLAPGLEFLARASHQSGFVLNSEFSPTANSTHYLREARPLKLSWGKNKGLQLRCGQPTTTLVRLIKSGACLGGTFSPHKSTVLKSKKIQSCFKMFSSSQR